MAQKVTIQLVDDVDGSEATETVAFGLDGRDYEIDLNGENAEKLRASLADFVGVARGVKKSGRAKSKTGAPKSGSGVDPKAVRTWARDNGIDCPDRGRVPSSVTDQYLAATA